MNLQFPNILRLVREKNISLHLGEIKLITTRNNVVMLVSKEFQRAYYGRFTDEAGTFVTGRDWNRQTHDLMIEIDHIGIPRIAQIGKALGHCCICGRTLSDERSVKWGIGPICAENVGFIYPADADEPLEPLDLIAEYEADPMFKLEHEQQPDPQVTEFVFNEHYLRAEIARVFGEHGAHMDVYDTLMKKAGVTK